MNEFKRGDLVKLADEWKPLTWNLPVIGMLLKRADPPLDGSCVKILFGGSVVILPIPCLKLAEDE